MTAADDTRSLLASTMGEYTDVIRRLVGTYGVKLSWASLGVDVGHWDGPHRAATVNVDSPIDDQVWFVREIETLCSIGRHAVPAARPRVHLRVV